MQDTYNQTLAQTPAELTLDQIRAQHDEVKARRAALQQRPSEQATTGTRRRVRKRHQLR